MTLSARAAAATDHDVVERMMLALYAEDPSPYAMTGAKARATLMALHGERGRVVVLLVDDAVAGYALLCSFWSNEIGGALCVIDEIYVDAPWRGRGVATWLITSLLDRSTPWFRDAVALELEVTPQNAKARALYARLGFRDVKNAMMRARVPDGVDADDDDRR